MLCLPAKSVEELPGDGSPGGGELHGAVGPVSVRPHDGPVHADFLLVPDLTWPELLCDAMDRLSCSSGINPTETFGRRCVSVHLTLPNSYRQELIDAVIQVWEESSLDKVTKSTLKNKQSLNLKARSLWSVSVSQCEQALEEPRPPAHF